MSAPVPNDAPFSAQLRVRPGIITLGAESAAERWTVRVQLSEAWDAVRVSVPPSESVRAVKLAVLEAMRPNVRYHEDYVMKLRGVAVGDEGASLADVGAADGSIFLVMYRRRRPVR
jgi:hypothetical protein